MLGRPPFSQEKKRRTTYSKLNGPSLLREGQTKTNNYDIKVPIIGQKFEKSVIGDNILNAKDDNLNLGADIDDDDFSEDA